MSVVVAIKDGDKVWMACDSQTSYGGTKECSTTSNNHKIFKQRSNTLIGVVGRARLNNVIRVEDELIDELTHLKDEVDFKYVVKTIVPKLFTLCDKYGLTYKDKQKEQKYIDGAIIMAHKDKIYNIDADGCVTDVPTFYATGSGYSTAIGFLNQCDMADVKDNIVRSVKSACESDLFVNYPIIVMNTKDDEVIIVDKE